MSTAMSVAQEEYGSAEKAAIVLLSLGEDVAAPVFRYLPEKAVRRLSSSLSRVEEIGTEATEVILKEFHADLNEGDFVLPDGASYFERLIDRAYTGPDAEKIKKTLGTDAGAGLESLDDVDSRLLSNIIQKEHPQTIALVLAHIESNKAAEALSQFPESLQNEVVFRIARLDAVSADILGEVEQALLTEISGLGTIGSQSAGGVERVADILNQMDKATESRIVESLEDMNSELAEEIRQLMFIFEDLIKVDDRGIQALLKEVDNSTLVLALKTAGEEIRSKIFRNLSKRATELIMEDLTNMPPVRLSDVEKAQQTIVRQALKMEEEGRLTIAGAGGDDALV
jgi:flagellar motor switch protein FliG